MKKFDNALILKILFVISIAIIFFISALTYKHLVTINDYSKMVEHSYKVNLYVEKVMSDLKDAETGQRGYIITKNEKYLEPFYKANRTINHHLNTVLNLTKDNKEQQTRIKKIKQLAEKRLFRLNYNLNLIKKNPLTKVDIGPGKILMDSIRVEIDKMAVLENKTLNERKQKQSQILDLTPIFIYLTLLLTLGIISIAFIRINSDLRTMEDKKNELSISNEMSLLAEELGNFGVWKLDLSNNAYTFSDNMYRILGYEPGAIASTSEAYMERMLPDDQKKVTDLLSKMFETNHFHSLGFRIYRADTNEMRHFTANNKLITDKDGKQYLIGITRDVTEDIKTSEKIEQQNEHLITINNELSVVNESKAFGEIIGKYGNWHWNPATDKWYFSKNLYRILGAEPDSFPANLEYFFKYIHPDDLEMVQQKAQELMTNESLPGFEYRIIQADSGNIIHVKSLGRAIIKKDGEKLVAGVTIDITDEYNQNREILLKNESLSLSETIGDYGTWQWNIKDDTFLFSDHLYELFGFKRGEIDENLQSFMPAIHPDDVKLVSDKVAEMFTTKSFEPFSHRIYRNDDNSLRYLYITSKLITDKKGNEYLLSVTSDITKTISDSIALKEQNRILEANNKELQAFNYVASHDLQEPLRKIQTFISRLEDTEADVLTESGKLYLNRIQSASKRMRILIDDLLQFSRTTRAEKTFEKANLNELLENSKLELAELIREKKAVIQNNELPDLRVIPFQIQQLFTNLIGNSIKYSKTDTIPTIEISGSIVKGQSEELLPKSAQEKFLKIVVSDNGIGFSNDYADKIFELFSRLHNKDEYSGTGIGLAICKKIVENHKGYIFAKGIENQGSQFTIYLPFS